MTTNAAARKGDLIVVKVTHKAFYLKGGTRVYEDFRIGAVSSVSRTEPGRIAAWTLNGGPQKGSPEASWVVSQERVDVHAALAAVSKTTNSFTTLQQAADFLSPFKLIAAG